MVKKQQQEEKYNYHIKWLQKSESRKWRISITCLVYVVERDRQEKLKFMRTCVNQVILMN